MPGATVTTDGTTLSIGVLAISAGNVSEVQPFATQAVATYWPGTPGSVTVTNAGTHHHVGHALRRHRRHQRGRRGDRDDQLGTSYRGNFGATIEADASDVTVTNTGIDHARPATPRMASSPPASAAAAACSRCRARAIGLSSAAPRTGTRA